MREGWEVKKLGECFRLKSGEMLSANGMKEGDYPVFGGNGIAGRHDNFNLSGSNVIIGRVGALCGNVRHLKEELWLTDNAFRIVDFKYDFDHSFLTYLLNFQNLRNAARQAAQPVISNSSLKDIILTFPKSLSEQKRIVAILDEAFAAIDKAKANLEKNLQNAKELFETYLFVKSGTKKKLGELVNIATGKLNANVAVENGKYPFFTCSREVYKIDNYAFDGEAILLAGNNAVGDFNVKHYKGKFNAYQRTYVITTKCDAKLNYKFLYYQMEKSLAALKERAVGAGTKFLKLPVIQAFEIDYPTIQEQNEIVDKLNRIAEKSKRLQFVYQQKLTALAELKKSILQKAFVGELTAKELV